MIKFDLLILGNSGWGDELLISSIMTILVSLSSMALGLFIAIFIAIAKIQKKKFFKFLANFYTTVIRGVPELLIIYLLFFGGSAGVMFVAKIFGYNGYIELNAFMMGTIAIGCISAAYSSEVLRGAYSIIDKGQIEAAKSLGMSNLSCFLKILAPQIIRYAIPGLGNVWQITLKDTALISITGLVEIMRQSSVAARSTHSPFTFYLAAAVLYLCLTTFSTIIFDKIEVKSKKNEVTI